MGRRVRKHKRMIVREVLNFSFVKRARNRGHTPIIRAGLEPRIQVFEMFKSYLDRAVAVFGASNYVIR